MENSIHNIETKIQKSDNGDFPAIVMGLNIFDNNNIPDFMDTVIDKVKYQIMCSPPETKHMLITLIGNMTSNDFKKIWNDHVKKDNVLQVFMSKMIIADILHLKKDGEVLDKSSLI